MTDRHVAYTVILDQEIREDDAEAIVTALKMVKGVIRVAAEGGAGGYLSRGGASAARFVDGPLEVFAGVAQRKGASLRGETRA